MANFETIFSSGYYKQMIFEFLLALCSPHIFLKNWRIKSYVVELDVTIEYGANDLILFLVWLKFYIVIRTRFYTSKFSAP